MVSHGNRRQVGPGDQQHVGAVRGERSSRHGTRDHARQIEHANARERTLALGPRLWRGLADFRDRDQRQSGERLGMRRRRPFVMRAHEARRRSRRHRPRSRTPRRPIASARPELLRAPACSSAPCRRRRGDGGNWCAAARTCIAGLVDAGDRVPGRRRRLAVDAQITFAPAFDHGMAHVDGRRPAPAAAHFPDLGRRQSGRGDADLCGGGDAKRGRQLRLIAGQRERVERGSFAAGGGPDIGKNFAGLFLGFASARPLPDNIRRNVTRMERERNPGDLAGRIALPGLRCAPSGYAFQRHRTLAVIASAAKQSIARQAERWIASLRSQ